MLLPEGRPDFSRCLGAFVTLPNSETRPEDGPHEKLRDLLRSAGWQEFTLLLAVAVICSSVTVFVAVTDVVREGELHDAETRWMQGLRSPDDPSRPRGPLWLERMCHDMTLRRWEAAQC